MAKDVVAEFIVRQVAAPLAPEGGSAELLDIHDGVAYVRYKKGYNPDCAECVLAPDDFRLFLLDAFKNKAPHVKDVHVESVEPVQ